MLKKVEMYTVICDGCGVDAFEREEFSCYHLDFALEEAIEEQNYMEINEKHYCENCYEYDDELEDYKPKEDNT